jgi:hypothetical protein
MLWAKKEDDLSIEEKVATRIRQHGFVAKVTQDNEIIIYKSGSRGADRALVLFCNPVLGWKVMWYLDNPDRLYMQNLIENNNCTLTEEDDGACRISFKYYGFEITTSTNRKPDLEDEHEPLASFFYWGNPVMCEIAFLSFVLRNRIKMHSGVFIGEPRVTLPL